MGSRSAPIGPLTFGVFAGDFSDLPLLCPGSRFGADSQWMSDYRIERIAELQLHHLYRAMAWLGEELAAGALVPRCIKGSARGVFVRARRDLFSDLSLLFMDTTSLSLHGQRHGLAIKWADLLPDLDRLQEATIEKDGKRHPPHCRAGQVGRVFQAAGITLPPNLHERAA